MILFIYTQNIVLQYFTYFSVLFLFKAKNLQNVTEMPLDV